MGDFNARTSNLLDYCILDERLVDELNLDIDEQSNECNPDTVLKQLKLPLSRTNQDNK